MTPEQAIAELRAMVSDGTDEEGGHSRADRIVCEVLRSAGLGAVADAFKEAAERVPFWYS